jgi:hypothetical protein
MRCGFQPLAYHNSFHFIPHRSRIRPPHFTSFRIGHVSADEGGPPRCCTRPGHQVSGPARPGGYPGPVPCASRRIASKPDAKPDETGRVRFPSGFRAALAQNPVKPGRNRVSGALVPGLAPTLRVAGRRAPWTGGPTQFPGRVALVASGRVPWWCTTTALGRWPGCGSGCRPAPS